MGIRHIVAKQRLSGDLKWIQSRGFDTPEVTDNAFRVEPHKWIRKVSAWEETPPSLGRQGWGLNFIEFLAIVVLIASVACSLGAYVAFLVRRRVRQQQQYA